MEESHDGSERVLSTRELQTLNVANIHQYPFAEKAKPFRCPVVGCEKAYINQNGLKYHKKYGHQNQQLNENDDGTFSIVGTVSFIPLLNAVDMDKDRPHQCEMCGKRYKTPDGLEWHYSHAPSCKPEWKPEELQGNVQSFRTINQEETANKETGTVESNIAAFEFDRAACFQREIGHRKTHRLEEHRMNKLDFFDHPHLWEEDGLGSSQSQSLPVSEKELEWRFDSRKNNILHQHPDIFDVMEALNIEEKKVSDKKEDDLFEGESSDDQSHGCSKNKQSLERSFTSDEFQLLETSVPMAASLEFQTLPIGSRPQDLSIVKNAAMASMPLQSFATAQSSVASYATPPSGPRRWGRVIASSRLRRNENALSETASFDTDRTNVEDLSDDELLIDHPGFRTLRAGISQEVARCWLGDQRPEPYDIEAGVEQELSFLLLDPVVSLDELTEKLKVQIKSRFSSVGINQLEAGMRAHIYRFANGNRLIERHPTVARELKAVYGAFSDEWLTRLRNRGLILAPEEELDWSGRGQHVVYARDEREKIPLLGGGYLGSGTYGFVDKVKCRRIHLARKKIRCSRKLTPEEVVAEVAILHRLQHRHIIRLVGTYLIQRDLFILMYPVATHNLEKFLDIAANRDGRARWKRIDCNALLFGVIGCLTGVVAFLHGQNVKHMDIKPANILLRHFPGEPKAKVYITDFGIARAYKTLQESYTDSSIGCTPIYAAPEVVNQHVKGPPADIFSLGCVFLEILASLLSTNLDDQQTALQETRDDTDSSYQHNVDAVLAWYEQKRDLIKQHFRKLQILSVKGEATESACEQRWTNAIPKMLAETPEDRPSAACLNQLTDWACCGDCFSGPEAFEEE